MHQVSVHPFLYLGLVFVVGDQQEAVEGGDVCLQQSNTEVRPRPLVVFMSCRVANRG